MAGLKLAWVIPLLLVTASGVANAEPSKQVCIDAATDGQKARDDGHLLSARQSFLTCAASTCPGLVRTECAKWLAELDATLPSVVLGAKTAEGNDLTAVHVDLDGKPFVDALDGRPRPLDPGAHHLRFRTAAGKTTELDVLVRAGETARVVVATFLAEPAPVVVSPPVISNRQESPSAAPLWIFGGLTVASAALATSMIVYAHDENDLVSASCSPRCSDGDLRPLRTSIVVSNLALAASVGSLGAFGYFVWRRATFTVSPAGASAMIRY